VGVASRATAANAADNRRYRRRATTRNDESQTIIGGCCDYTVSRDQDYKYGCGAQNHSVTLLTST